MNKKQIWIGIFFLLLGVIVFGFWLGFRATSQSKSSYQTYSVKTGDIQISISAAGTIQPTREIEVKSKASGEVLKRYVREGAAVKKGDLLVTLDKTEEQTRIRQEQSNVLSAKAKVLQSKTRLNEAIRQLNQTSALVKEKLTPKEDKLRAENQVIIAQADLDISQASLVKAQEELNTAKDRFSDTEIRSPITGIVLEKQVEEGQIIASGISSTSGGTPIMTIGDMSAIISRAEIDEVDIGKLKIGQHAWVYVDAYEGKEFQGILSHISPKGQDKSNITVFNIEIDITDPDKHLLKAGMTNTAKIIIEDRKDVLTLPSFVVQTRKNRHYVLIKQKRRIQRKQINVGLNNYETIEILAGLRLGDIVVIPPRSNATKPNTDRNTVRAMRRLSR